MIPALRKPHIEYRRGVWWCTVHRRGEKSKSLFKLVQAGSSVVEVWENFKVWPGV